MPDEPVQPGNRRFYRRIRNDQWQDETRQLLQVTAFVLRTNEAGLSVFDAAIATPHNVLEHQLNFWRNAVLKPTTSPKFRQTAQSNLEQYDNSVAGMLAQGWGVAELTESLFRRCGFAPSNKIDKHGHLEILGTKEAFEEQSLEIIDDPECRILSEGECLA